MENKWTTEMVADRFEEAMQTLKRWQVPGTKPKGYFNAWPEIVYTTWEIEMQDKLSLRLGSPTPDAIDRMHETFQWLWHLEIEERKLIWMRAGRTRWKVICWQLGCDRSTAWRKWVLALTKIAARLNK